MKGRLGIKIAHQSCNTIRISDLLHQEIPNCLFNSCCADSRSSVHRLTGCGLDIIFDVRQLTMFSPVAGVITRFRAVAGGNLNTVFPSRSTFHCKSITNINANMSSYPYCFANFNTGKVSRNIRTQLNYTIGIGIRNSICLINCTTIGLGFIAAPSPKNALEKARAVKPKSISGCCLNILSSGSLFIVTVIITITSFVFAVHRGAETTQNVQRFVVFCDIFQFLYKFGSFHYSTHSKMFLSQILLSTEPFT